MPTYLINFKQSGGRFGYGGRERNVERTIKVRAETKEEALGKLLEDYHNPFAIRVFVLGKTESLTRYPRLESHRYRY